MAFAIFRSIPLKVGRLNHTACLAAAAHHAAGVMIALAAMAGTAAHHAGAMTAHAAGAATALGAGTTAHHGAGMTALGAAMTAPLAGERTRKSQVYVHSFITRGLGRLINGRIALQVLRWSEPWPSAAYAACDMLLCLCGLVIDDSPERHDGSPSRRRACCCYVASAVCVRALTSGSRQQQHML